MDTNMLARGMEKFAEISPELQLNAILAYLYVAQAGECSLKEIEKALGTSGPVASRTISIWTEQKNKEVAGIGFIDRFEDPNDRRHKLLRLTPAGKQFYQSLRRKVDG